MRINGEDVITKVIAFKDDIFEFGKPYWIKFNDEDDCIYTLTNRNHFSDKETVQSLKTLLMNGVYGLFESLYDNNTCAEFIITVSGFSSNILYLKIPVSICDDSEAEAAGVLSPVEIIVCDKMGDKDV